MNVPEEVEEGMKGDVVVIVREEVEVESGGAG